MYYNGKVYDEVCKKIIDLYIDYSIRTFPLDVDELIKKMGYKLIKYSQCEEKRELFMKKSQYAFIAEDENGFYTEIFYNDDSNYAPYVNGHKLHELGHGVLGDSDASKDDLADYFSKYIRCPIPYLIYKKYFLFLTFWIILM